MLSVAYRVRVVRAWRKSIVNMSYGNKKKETIKLRFLVDLG